MAQRRKRDVLSKDNFMMEFDSIMNYSSHEEIIEKIIEEVKIVHNKEYEDALAKKDSMFHVLKMIIPSNLVGFTVWYSHEDERYYLILRGHTHPRAITSPAARKFNGMIMDITTNDVKIVCNPLPNVTGNNNFIPSSPDFDHFDYYPIRDGTPIHMYWSSNAKVPGWRFATRKLVSVTGVAARGSTWDKLILETFEKCGLDINSPIFNKEYTYNFVFKHPHLDMYDQPSIREPWTDSKFHITFYKYGTQLEGFDEKYVACAFKDIIDLENAKKQEHYMGYIAYAKGGDKNFISYYVESDLKKKINTMIYENVMGMENPRDLGLFVMAAKNYIYSKQIIKDPWWHDTYVPKVKNYLCKVADELMECKFEYRGSLSAFAKKIQSITESGLRANLSKEPLLAIDHIYKKIHDNRTFNRDVWRAIYEDYKV